MSKEGSNDPLLHAIAYARRGWPVHPLHGIVDGVCTCGPRGDCADDPTRYGKHPRTQHGLNDATCDEEQIRRWWRMWPDANVGIRMGDGLVGIDVDPRHGGEQTLEVLIDGRPFPRTLTVATGGGGLHFIFTGTVDRQGRDVLGPGLDVKGVGGYLVAPPSLHPSGLRYSWLVDDQEPAPLPEYLRPRPRARPSQIPNPMSGQRFGPNYALAALRDELEEARRRRDGQGRRDGLFRAGLKLGRLVFSADLRYEDVLAGLVAAGIESGLSADVASSHAANGLNKGLRNEAVA